MTAKPFVAVDCPCLYNGLFIYNTHLSSVHVYVKLACPLLYDLRWQHFHLMVEPCIISVKSNTEITAPTHCRCAFCTWYVLMSFTLLAQQHVQQNIPSQSVGCAVLCLPRSGRSRSSQRRDSRDYIYVCTMVCVLQHQAKGLSSVLKPMLAVCTL